jgi:hypothetical protein
MNAVTKRLKEETMILYHGTATPYLPSIILSGLKPQPGKNFKVIDVDSLTANAPTELGVYLTDSREIAEKFARLRASYLKAKPRHIVAEYPNRHDISQMVYYKSPSGPAPIVDAKPIVLEVQVSPDVAKQLNEDEQTQLFGGGAFWYPGVIPPSAIVKVDTL